jgi:hypothetical protein
VASFELPFEDRLHLRRQRAGVDRGVVSEDGELLGRDLLERVAEPLGVVEADRREDGQLRRDHVRRVEAAAEAGLDHGDLDARLGEGDEGGGGEELELGDRALIVRGLAVGGDGRLLGPLERAGERILGDRPAPDPDPLTPVADVRRRVGAGADAVGLEQRRRHQRHRGLAVGADDVDRREPVLRHPEQRAEAAHALEPELPADRLARGEDLFRAAGYPSSSSSAR